MDNRQSGTRVKPKILVSACLLGEPVRYDGQSKAIVSEVLQKLVEQDRVIAYCPEVGGGLPTPREPAEVCLIKSEMRVKTASGNDVTKAFQDGAKQALQLCQQYGIEVAILTELSPSCGSNQIYDGSFSRQSIDGSGITTSLLRDSGIKVFNQYQISEAIANYEHDD